MHVSVLHSNQIVYECSSVCKIPIEHSTKRQQRRQEKKSLVEKQGICSSTLLLLMINQLAQVYCYSSAATPRISVCPKCLLILSKYEITFKELTENLH